MLDEVTSQEETLIKRSYIFVRKSYQEMQIIFESNGDEEILRNEDHVTILKRWDCFEKIRFTEIKKYQFAEKEVIDNRNVDIRRNKDTDFIELSITICKFNESDKTKISFLPFVYQEKNNSDKNKFIVYDICKDEALERLAMSPPEKEKEYIYENENGYN